MATDGGRDSDAAERLCMTTLELARAIADAVLRADPKRRRDSTRDPPTQAVIDTLHDTGSWFMDTGKADDDEEIPTDNGRRAAPGRRRL
jgi:hypothetical protein